MEIEKWPKAANSRISKMVYFGIVIKFFFL